MRLQPMPVFDALRQPGRRVYMTANDDESFLTQHGKMDEFDICKRVWFGTAPDVGDILAAGIKSGEGAKLRESVGPQKLPFTHMWLEGIWPVKTTGHMKGAVAYAIYCHSNDARDPDTLKPLDLETTTYQIWALMFDGSIRRVPMCMVNVVDPNGLVEGTTMKALHPEGNFILDVPKENKEMTLWPIGMVMPAMWAIGLMNCKNVHLEERTTGKKSRKQRRPRPELKYHTIVLPGGRSSGSGGGTKSGVESACAQHQVRGHFKTYTADAPLMGKHTGTYWWGWQVRGKRENGQVIADYNLTGALS